MARGLCAALLATVSLLAVPAGPASAALAWVTRDDLDDDPENRWIEDGVGSGGAFFVDGDGRLGTVAGLLYVNVVGGWSSLGRTVNIPAATPHCTASIYLAPLLQRGDGNLYVWVEVIDPATWTYLAVKQTNLRWTDDQYSKFTTPRFTASQVFFRVAVYGPDRYGLQTSAFMDDMRFDCSSV